MKIMARITACKETLKAPIQRLRINNSGRESQGSDPAAPLFLRQTLQRLPGLAGRSGGAEAAHNLKR